MTAVAATAHSGGGWRAEAWTSRTASPPEDHYDVALLTSSWDSRSLCLPQGCPPTRYGTAVLLMPENRGNSGRRDEHDAAVQGYAHQTADRVVAVRGRSEDVYGTWQLLLRALDEACDNVRGPVRALIDLAPCPRYASLGALTHLLRERGAERVDLTYAEAVYPPRTPSPDLFTLGRWHTVAIPGLEGEFNPIGPRVYVVAVGFEGAKTLRAATRADPDRLSILFPDPGFVPDYPARTLAANVALLREFAVPEEQIARAHAGDAVAAWAALARTRPERVGDNVYYLCAGTKPHALALALRALETGDAAVLYVQPAAHKETFIEPSGTFWTYRVQADRRPGEVDCQTAPLLSPQ